MIRSRTFWVGLLLLLGYWPVAYLTPANPQFLSEHAVRIAFGAVAGLLYLPAAWRALAMSRPTYSGQLLLGIVMNVSGGTAASVWLVVWRLAGRPDWMIQANVSGFFLWWQILGYVLHVTAKRRKTGGVERTNWRWIGAAAGLAAVLLAVVVGWQPDLSALAERMRPWLDDGD